MIYLDYNATTPVAPEVAAAMQPFLGPEFGNPSCDYPLGLRAREAMHQARREVAALLNCAPDEVVFTSGATEANNLVLKGVALSRGSGRIITAATEHPAVLAPCRWLASSGFERDGAAGGLARFSGPRGGAPGPDPGHHPDQHHARQQRDRGPGAPPRDRRHCPGGRRAAAYRRGPERGQGQGGRGGIGGGFSHRGGAQILRPQRGREPYTCAGAGN